MGQAHGFLWLFRSSKLSVDKERRYSLEDDSTLAEAVQRYLPYLEALSWAASNPRPRTRHDRPSAQVTLAALSVGWACLTAACSFLCAHTGRPCKSWAPPGFSPASHAGPGACREGPWLTSRTRTLTSPALGAHPPSEPGAVTHPKNGVWAIVEVQGDCGHAGYLADLHTLLF